MSAPDLVGHLAYCALFTGTLAVARGHRWGWWARLVGEVGWVGVGAWLGLTSVVVWGVVFVVVDGVGVWRDRGVAG